jgi:hypothetical protein
MEGGVIQIPRMLTQGVLAEIQRDRAEFLKAGGRDGVRRYAKERAVGRRRRKRRHGVEATKELQDSRLRWLCGTGRDSAIPQKTDGQRGDQLRARRHA